MATAGAVAAAAARGGGAVSVNDLLFDLQLDNINLFQLVRWMNEHKMVFKVGCYVKVWLYESSTSTIDSQRMQTCNLAVHFIGWPILNSCTSRILQRTGVDARFALICGECVRLIITLNSLTDSLSLSLTIAALQLATYAGSQGKPAGEVQLNTPTPRLSTITAAAPAESPHKDGEGSTSGRQAPSVPAAHDGCRTAVGYATSCLQCFVSFLVALTNTNADGRIILESAGKQGRRRPGGADGGGAASNPVNITAAAAGGGGGGGSGGASAALPLTAQAATASSSRSSSRDGVNGASSSGRLQFILLNAARHFGNLLSQARSVVLVSGTLAPLTSLTAQLFPDVPSDRLVHFECGHVIPQEQLLALSIGRGPLGRVLDCRHESRGKAEVMDELGQLLFNLAGVVPEGLVVFVASFQYLEQLMGRWEEMGMKARMETRKAVFR